MCTVYTILILSYIVDLLSVSRYTMYKHFMKINLTLMNSITMLLYEFIEIWRRTQST